MLACKVIVPDFVCFSQVAFVELLTTPVKTWVDELVAANARGFEPETFLKQTLFLLLALVACQPHSLANLLPDLLPLTTLLNQFLAALSRKI